MAFEPRPVEPACPPLVIAIDPGKGLGPFYLGASLCTVLQHIESNYQTFPSVDLAYNQDDPLKHDLVLSLTPQGIQLCFDARSQRLKAINMFSFEDGVTISYRSHKLVQGPLTFVRLYRVFGPSHGEYDRTRRSYVLEYPGLCLLFEIPAEFERDFVTKERDLTVDMQLPDGTNPLLTHLLVFGGSDRNHPEVPLSLGQNVMARSHFEQVDVLAGRGLLFTRRNARVSFGDSCQDVISKLGPPEDTYYKMRDAMSIHGGNSSVSNTRDFFFNYFALGIDVLFSGTTKTVKKFVLHTNMPGHYNFGRYARCDFRINLTQHLRQADDGGELFYAASDVDGQSVPETRAPTRVTVQSPGSDSVSPPVVEEQPGEIADVESDDLQVIGLSDDEDDYTSYGQADVAGQARNRAESFSSAGSASVHRGHSAASSMAQSFVSSRGMADDDSCITVGSTWGAIEGMLGSAGDPITVNRPPSPNSSNPFGPTVVRHCHDLIFEVMGNGHIASITLFQP